jgi:phosphonate transport system ATP-binding protein
LKLELHGLAVCHPAARAGALALQPMNLQVAAGEQLAVIGPSGAGKTTLLQAMACALPPRSGMLRWSRRCWRAAPTSRQKPM